MRRGKISRNLVGRKLAKIFNSYTMMVSVCLPVCRSVRFFCSICFGSYWLKSTLFIHKNLDDNFAPSSVNVDTPSSPIANCFTTFVNGKTNQFVNRNLEATFKQNFKNFEKLYKTFKSTIAAKNREPFFHEYHHLTHCSP